MQQFIAKFGDRVQGVLSGFDRLVFRGRLRAISYVEAMQGYLGRRHVLLKDFAGHVKQVSERLKEAVLAEALQAERYRYLASTRINKDEAARQFACERPATSGLICTFGIVEPCFTFDIHRNKETHELELVRRERKCMHLYQYWNHPVVGYCSARVQTWFPFTIQVCLNGREWAARTMDREGLKYRRDDNCFPWVEDFGRAQQILDAQLAVNWPNLLDGFAAGLNPLLGELFDGRPIGYYWTAYQTEWATDVMFRKADDLKRLVPLLMRHAMTSLRCEDVLGFLGKKVPERFPGDASRNLRRREEGMRAKHWVNENSIKMYDKSYTTVGSVLRAAETTINNPSDLQVYRPKEGDPDGELKWRQMRKGVADLHRRAEVSQRANERYLDALAAVDDSTRLQEWTRDLERGVEWNGKRVRALHPFSAQDHELLQAVARGEFAINGLRNRDLQALLFATPASDEERRRRSAAVSRKLRLLRAHGLLKKVGHTHRYQVTSNGRKAISAILTAQEASINSLTAKAA